jgi:hypothetical protein
MMMMNIVGIKQEIRSVSPNASPSLKLPVSRTVVYHHKKRAGIHARTSYIYHRRYVTFAADGICLSSLLFNGFFPGVQRAGREGGHSLTSV